jgi:hypothetical protein
MRRVLQTELGKTLYKQRKALIEPVFGHTKFNRSSERFQRRGLAACRSEWRLITATHNLSVTAVVSCASARGDAQSSAGTRSQVPS